MSIKKGSIVLLLGLVNLAIAVGSSISPNPTKQAVGQNTQPTDNSSEPLTLPQPKPTDLDNCIESTSVSLSKQLKLEKCRLRTTNWLNGRFILTKDGKQIWKWAYPQSTLVVDFQAFLADLDGDRSQELVIANHDGTSNGIAIRYWTIYILPEPLTRLPQQPLQFGIEEYGKQGTFVPDGNQFEIWTAQWSGGIIGQQWRYQDGQLIPTNHPVLERWYSFNFEKERAKTYSNPRIPYLWLASPKVQAHSEHPLLESTNVLSSEDGVIQSISEECIKNHTSCINATKVIFKPNQNKPRSYFYNHSGHYYPPGEESKSLAYFGDWSSRRIYPTRYLPSNPTHQFNGRQSRLIAYRSKTNGQSLFKILWLM